LIFSFVAQETKAGMRTPWTCTIGRTVPFWFLVRRAHKSWRWPDCQTICWVSASTGNHSRSARRRDWQFAPTSCQLGSKARRAEHPQPIASTAHYAWQSRLTMTPPGVGTYASIAEGTRGPISTREARIKAPPFANEGVTLSFNFL